MNKKECLKALETLQEKYINLDVVDELICFKNLIDERYELERNFKILEKNYDELYDMVHYPKPYKLEDLKENMYIYDYETKEILLISYITEIIKTGEIILYCFEFKNEQGIIGIKFEENRFYPITKAMEVK